MCGAEAGFFFTTGYLTKEAKKTAKQFSWLKVYEGTELLDLAEKAEETEMGNKNPD